MNYLSKVQRGIDYIEANLDNTISFSQIAQHAGISQWHFQRIFKALTNETLKTYIRSRRLANSLDKLLNSNNKIIDIALASGYESQESYTRAFKAAFKLTPNEYRKLGDNSLFLKKLEFNSDYLKHINHNVSLTPEIISYPRMQLVGLKTLFYGIDSDKNNIGAKLPALWANFMSRIDEVNNNVAGLCYGVIKQIANNTDQLEYYAAIEVNNINKLPPQMHSITIEQTNYAKFTHKGEVKNIDNTVNYIYSSWLLNSEKQHSTGPDLEIYGSQYDPLSENSVFYYAIPIG